MRKVIFAPSSYYIPSLKNSPIFKASIYFLKDRSIKANQIVKLGMEEERGAMLANSPTVTIRGNQIRLLVMKSYFLIAKSSTLFKLVNHKTSSGKSVSFGLLRIVVYFVLLRIVECVLHFSNW